MANNPTKIISQLSFIHRQTDRHRHTHYFSLPNNLRNVISQLSFSTVVDCDPVDFQLNG